MTLLEEIQSKCTQEEIDSKDYHLIASKVNVNRTKISSTLISERGILERYPDGPIAADSVLTKLETFSTTQHPLASVVKRAIKFLETPEGLDIGSNTTRLMIDSLYQVPGTPLTEDEAIKLKSLAPSVDDHVTWFQCMDALGGK